MWRAHPDGGVQIGRRGRWEVPGNHSASLPFEGEMIGEKSFTEEFPLDQWKEAFRLFEKGTGLKYLLYPID